MRIIPADLFRVIVYIITIMASNLENAHASCAPEQAQSCKQAVKMDKLGSLPAGGKCTKDSYRPYTHRCSIPNYTGAAGSCCCAFEQSVMCCYYKQSWGEFRCSIADDTVDTLPPQSLPLEILLPAILGPVAVLVCCVICCVKCWCYRYEDEGDCMCCCPDDKHKEKDIDKRLPYPPGHYMPTEERMPLTCGPRYSSSPSEGSNSKLMNHCNGVGLMSSGDPNVHIEPSAPPILYEDVTCPHRTSVCISHSNCNHSNRNSQHCACMTSQTAPPCLSNCAACKMGGSHHGAYCCQIANAHARDPQGGRDPHYPSCAPPMYEDITKDPLVSVSDTSVSDGSGAPVSVVPLGEASCPDGEQTTATCTNTTDPAVSIYNNRPRPTQDDPRVSGAVLSPEQTVPTDASARADMVSDSTSIDDALVSFNSSALP